MGRLAKTGIALLGIAMLGGLVSLLGGPNVFSTFSNAISTILPEFELAVEKTEEKQTQDQVPTPPKPEEESEHVGVEEELPESEEIAAASTPKEITKSPPVIALPQEPTVQAKLSVLFTNIQSDNPVKKASSPKPKAAEKSLGGQEFGAPDNKRGSGSGGSGVICVTVGSREPWELKEGERCGNLILRDNKVVVDRSSSWI